MIVIIGGIVMYVLKPKWHDEYGQRFQDIAYADRQHNTYGLYLPNDAEKNDSLALILFVHGGSWLGGDKEWHHGDCYTWVQKGYATATMNYSLLGEEGVSLLTMQDEIEACIPYRRLRSREGCPYPPDGYCQHFGRRTLGDDVRLQPYTPVAAAL